MRLKTIIFSISALCVASGISQAALPEFKSALPIQTYDVGENKADTSIHVMNHNKAKQVLLIRLSDENEMGGFSIADMSINIAVVEAISHLNEKYLTGDNSGFLDRYPNAPVNLATYTSLGFDSSSDHEDFNITAKRLISESTGYLWVFPS